MGKYDKEEELKDVKKNIQRDLFWIVNELAEANRLKRLEMKVEFVERFHLKSFELTLKELEDQA